MRRSFLLVVILYLLRDSVCQDDVPVVCGGYVKSKFKADFTKIKINLYSVDGTLKYTTDCAANNGYFLLPVYDPGFYVVKPVSPDGWMTAPSEVALLIKKESDLCSSGKDIQFELIGFQLQGQVTSGGDMAGPSGVEVCLSPIATTTDDGPIVRYVNTGIDGRFVMDGVFPGTYHLTASHPLWEVSEQSVAVVIEDDSLMAPYGLTVLGYDVKGVVRSGGEPVQGVLLFLHLQPGQRDVHVNCSSDGVNSTRNSTLHQTPLLCHTLSDEGGAFIFHPLPPAAYLIVPFYQQDQLQFEVHPTELKFDVSNDSVLLSPIFEVQGFSVTGQVMSSRQGSPLPGARVFLGNHHSAITNTQGQYSLLNVTSGTYLLKVKAAQLQFEPCEVHISPSSPTLPSISPDKYVVCGHVLEGVPTAASGELVTRRVEVTTTHSDPLVAMATTTIPGGEFCLFLALGEYEMKVVVSAAEAKRGLLILPEKQLVAMLGTPITNIKFSQSLADLSGTVRCIEDCPKKLSVKLLRSYDMKQALVAKVSANGKEANFKLDGVLQGQVKVSLNYAAWCWNASEFVVDIGTGSPETLQFVHTGYSLQFEVSHEALVSYHLLNGTITEVVLIGEGSICLDDPGMYFIHPQSCHKFENAPFSFNTASPKPLVLQSAGHSLQILVLCEVSDATLSLIVRFKDGMTEISPERIEQEEGGVYKYHFISTARAGDEVDIVPQSSLLMFSPSSLNWIVGEDCPEEVPSFQGSMGEVIEGKIEPALAGVAVVLDLGEAGQITTHTDEEGKYRVGPFRGRGYLSTSVEFPGYTFERLPGSWTFKAVKLCRVDISVNLAAGGGPLGKVLVSVNGDSFRQNALTDEDGVITYHNMAPGQYFIKPFLREFEFFPSSHVVNVTPGRSEALTFSGKRVAFSCSGRVSTLNRRPVAGAVVQVSGAGLNEGCSSHNQLATTDDGFYRLLGLLPGCQYNLSVKESEDISHVLPPYKALTVNEEDVVSSDFLVVLQTKVVYISGWVNTNPKFIASLKAAVSLQGSREESPLHVVMVDPVGFFDFPALPIHQGGKGYMVSLDSNLASHSYRFSNIELSVSGVEDSHIMLQFDAEEILLDTDAQSRGSVLALLVVIAAAFALVNFEIVWANLHPYLIRTFSAFAAGSRRSSQKTRK